MTRPSGSKTRLGGEAGLGLETESCRDWADGVAAQAGSSSSSRSVDGGGVRERAETGIRSSGVMATFTESS